MNSVAPLIAVVDDEESIRKAMLRLLRSAHYRAEAFCSAADFLDSLPDRMPNCVILDLQMPNLTGVDVQRQLKERTDAPPVIIITAHDEPGTRQLCLDLGAALYLRKPIDGDALIDSIERILNTLRPAAAPLDL